MSLIFARQIVHTYEGHTADIHLLLPFGSHLVSIDNNSFVIISDIKSEGKLCERQSFFC